MIHLKSVMWFSWEDGKEMLAILMCVHVYMCECLCIGGQDGDFYYFSQKS